MNRSLCCGDKKLDLDTPKIMGVLNVTPDSFSDGGHYLAIDSALEQVEKMVSAGAAIIDVGGESTRPGAQTVSLEDESHRVIPVIESISKHYPDIIISVDTSKPELMSRSISAGVHMINDVNALRAPGAIDAVHDSKVAVCLMHMQGEPRTMQKNPQYDDVVIDVMSFLQERIIKCVEQGITYDRIVIDPGFGFGKTLEHNLILLRNLHVFADMDVALLTGLSRKTMIGTILDKPVEERLVGSVTAAILSMWLGANIIRVHDVAETIDALKIINAVRK